MTGEGERQRAHLDVAPQPLHVLLHLLLEPVRLALERRRQAAQRDAVVARADLRPSLELVERRREEVGLLRAHQLESVGGREEEREAEREGRTFSSSCRLRTSPCAFSSCCSSKSRVAFMRSVASGLGTPAPSRSRTNRWVENGTRERGRAWRSSGGRPSRGALMMSSPTVAAGESGLAEEEGPWVDDEARAEAEVEGAAGMTAGPAAAAPSCEARGALSVPLEPDASVNWSRSRGRRRRAEEGAEPCASCGSPD